MSTSTIARGRRLQRRIMAAGGPPPSRTAHYHQAIAILDAAEHGGGDLGFFPAVPAAVLWAVGILGSIAAAFVVVPIIQEARGVVRESGEAARGLVSLSKWIFAAGLALWVLQRARGRAVAA